LTLAGKEIADAISRGGLEMGSSLITQAGSKIIAAAPHAGRAAQIARAVAGRASGSRAPSRRRKPPFWQGERIHEHARSSRPSHPKRSSREAPLLERATLAALNAKIDQLATRFFLYEEQGVGRPVARPEDQIEKMPSPACPASVAYRACTLARSNFGC